ncbi:MAG: hypothetical protein EBU07_03040 [Betaproteobacteria bacterium]|nr:hypothetical protein [Betaproteobacteria bacterium]
MKLQAIHAVTSIAAVVAITSIAQARSSSANGEVGLAAPAVELTRTVESVRAETVAAVRARAVVSGEASYVAPTTLTRAAEAVRSEAELTAQMAHAVNGEAAQLPQRVEAPVVAVKPAGPAVHHYNGEAGLSGQAFASTRSAAEVRAEAMQAQRQGLIVSGEAGQARGNVASGAAPERTAVRAAAAEATRSSRFGNGEASM